MQLCIKLIYVNNITYVIPDKFICVCVCVYYCNPATAVVKYKNSVQALAVAHAGVGSP